MTKISILSCFSIAAFAVLGCGSSTSETPDAGTTTYGLTGGDNCYKVNAITPGYSDGCVIGVADVVNTSLPMNYSTTTYYVTLGTDGSLGGGAITNNQGTLVRDGDTTMTDDVTGTTCTLHQNDTTQLLMTANNQFTVSVTETESGFSAGCPTNHPAGSTCTSTWTWTMAIDTTVTPPNCGASP